ncbi:MAG: molecular chaperone HtpG [Myxococcota bacterium]
MGTEKRAFQTEVQQLLDLMIHSLYSNRDVFLRELVSNASDAIDKRRFEALTTPEWAPDAPYAIEIQVDPEARTLSVEDNGIGMSRDEVVDHIGTIARSGTSEFARALEEARRSDAPPELIGQFGVGFYASFMVAQRVELVTRRAGESGATRWESAGDGGYSIEDADRPEAGTRVVLHLREADPDDGLPDYTDEWTLRRIVKRYSDFVAYPIRLRVAGKEDAGDEPINSMKAIWTRPAEELEEAELAEFYRHIGHDWNDPLFHLATRIEGQFDARALLFVPSVAPFDLYHREMAHRGIQLYVKRVFIMDDCTELLPDHLRFVKGVVDAEDLSLNVSREMLQQDRQIRTIRNHLVKKVLESLGELLANDREKYLRFWAQFGPVLKEGLLARAEKKERILDLLMATTTASKGELSTLAEIVERMPEGQDEIYYMTGPSREVLEASPHLEAFRSRGIEVLLFTDPVDEVWLEQQPPVYRDKPWRSVGKGEVELPGGDESESEAEKERREEQASSFRGLLEGLRAAIQDDVKEVRLSSRLVESPACLVLEEGELSGPMVEMLKQAGQDVTAPRPILELNPDHPILARLRDVHEADARDPRIGRYAVLLLGLATLAEGGRPADPAAFGRELGELLVEAI